MVVLFPSLVRAPASHPLQNSHGSPPPSPRLVIEDTHSLRSLARALANVLESPLPCPFMGPGLPWDWPPRNSVFFSIGQSSLCQERGNSAMLYSLDDQAWSEPPSSRPGDGLGGRGKENENRISPVFIRCSFSFCIPGRLWGAPGVRKRPSGSGVLGDCGALWSKRHPGSLHQYLQICGLDPDGHEEQLTCSLHLHPSAWGLH